MHTHCSPSNFPWHPCPYHCPHIAHGGLLIDHTLPAHCPPVARALPTHCRLLCANIVSHMWPIGCSWPTNCSLMGRFVAILFSSAFGAYADHCQCIAHPDTYQRIGRSLQSDCPNIVSHMWPIGCSWPTRAVCWPAHCPLIAASLPDYSIAHVVHADPLTVRSDTSACIPSRVPLPTRAVSWPTHCPPMALLIALVFYPACGAYADHCPRIARPDTSPGTPGRRIVHPWPTRAVSWPTHCPMMARALTAPCRLTARTLSPTCGP